MSQSGQSTMYSAYVKANEFLWQLRFLHERNSRRTAMSKMRQAHPPTTTRKKQECQEAQFRHLHSWQTSKQLHKGHTNMSKLRKQTSIPLVFSHFRRTCRSKTRKNSNAFYVHKMLPFMGGKLINTVHVTTRLKTQLLKSASGTTACPLPSSSLPLKYASTKQFS